MVQRQRVRSKFSRLVKRSKYLPQGIATTITVAIITIIVLAPSALGITVSIQGLSNNQQLGSTGSFTFLAKITIDSNELVPLSGLNIILDGSTFSFNPNTGAAVGTPSSAITSVSPVNFGSGNLFTTGYGYSTGTLAAYSYSYGWKYGTPSATGYGNAGPQTFVWNVTLSNSNLAVGNHTIRLDVITTGMELNTYSSSTVTFAVVAGASQTVSIPTTSTTATVNNVATTNVTVVVTGATYTDANVPATITTIKFTSAPTTAVTVTTGTGKTPAKYIDVKAFNFASGTVTVTVSYTDAEVAGLDESALTLYYYSTSLSTWVQFSSVTVNTSANTVSGSIDVLLLTGTYISLAGTAPVATITPPAAGAGAGLPGVSATVNTNLRLVSLQVAPGSAVTVSLTLSSNELMTSGTITLTLPNNLRYSDLRTINFDGTSTLTGNTLVLERSDASGSKTATIFFKLTAPLDSTIKVGQTYTVTIDEVSMQGMTVNFQTSQTVTFNIVSPTVQNIYSALDSHFTNIPNPYTENRVPTITDIMNLLDFRLTGEVLP